MRAVSREAQLRRKRPRQKSKNQKNQRIKRIKPEIKRAAAARDRVQGGEKRRNLRRLWTG
jgi:hypothetical protein